VEVAPDKPQDGIGERVPPDDGFGRPGDGSFNTPPLVEAADTGPFFHDNSVDTLEAAVAFYSSRAFNGSPSGRALVAATGSGIDLDDVQAGEIAAFLRVLNALENIRQGRAYLVDARGVDPFGRSERGLRLAPEEIGDAVRVLEEAGLHADAVAELRLSLERIGDAQASRRRSRAIDAAIDALDAARRAMRQDG
jgi:hypothetical protein